MNKLKCKPNRKTYRAMSFNSVSSKNDILEFFGIDNDDYITTCMHGVGFIAPVSYVIHGSDIDYGFGPGGVILLDKDNNFTVISESTFDFLFNVDNKEE